MQCSCIKFSQIKGTENIQLMQMTFAKKTHTDTHKKTTHRHKHKSLKANSVHIKNILNRSFNKCPFP